MARNINIRQNVKPLVTALVLLLAGCAAPSPAPKRTATAPPSLTAPYAAAATAGQRIYRLNPSASQVLIFVGKTGALAGLGHRHVIEVHSLRGFARLRRNGSGHAELRFPVAALAVDPPAVRRSQGAPYAEPLDADARAGTRKHMLGKSVLNAARYPWIRLDITAPAANAATALTVRITLHGLTHSVAVQGKILRRNHHLWADGAFAFKQSSFGIKPYSIAFGALRVKDRLRVRYHLRFDRWRPAPAPRSH